MRELYVLIVGVVLGWLLAFFVASVAERFWLARMFAPLVEP